MSDYDICSAFSKHNKNYIIFLPLYNPIPAQGRCGDVYSRLLHSLATRSLYNNIICPNGDNASGYMTQILIETRTGVPEL